jgi:hypothetical protein
MSSKTENMHRNSLENADTDDDYRYFINPELPIEQIYNVLRMKGMSDSDIDTTIDKVKDARDRIAKVVGKFVRKIDSTYSHLDLPDIIKKGVQHAKKYGLTDVERKVFVNTVLKGDVHNNYTYMNQLRYTPMAKFLGFDFVHGHTIKLGPSDYSKLNELYALYESSKHIHANIKANAMNYRDCAPEAIDGQYDRTKNNVNSSIHPVIAALFFPKIEQIEKTMLFTNIARMVLIRSQAYLRDFKFNVQGNITSYEINADFELGCNISEDPNALEHFRDDTPIENIIKRYTAQIELYMTVDNLRQGRYYSPAGYAGYANYDNVLRSDGITGLGRVLNSYEWTFFDSPDAFAIQDEGTFLRKLLAVFSCRPTFTQLSSLSGRFGLGVHSVTGLAKTVFVNIPVINIKLPIDLLNDTPTEINLKDSMTQMDYFIEHKAFVPKNKSVVYSNNVAFFYANRRHPSINFNNTRTSLRFIAVPYSFINPTTINKAQIIFKDTLEIGRDLFELRSVVVLQRPSLSGIDIDVAIGCSALIVADSRSPSLTFGDRSDRYLHYNPSNAAIKYPDSATTTYVTDTPVALIPREASRPEDIGFVQEAKERGTIFIYAKNALPSRVGA